MSLEKRTLLEDTVRELVAKSWDLSIAIHDLWKTIVHEKKPVHTLLFKQIKKQAEEVKEICEELP